MPVFEYSGLNEAGKSIRGLKDAESAKALRTLLRKDGVYVTESRAADPGAVAGKGGKVSSGGMAREVDLRGMFGSGVGAQDIAIATRQLATLINAGIPLV